MKFAVVGHPIAHSKSPAMHNAAYRALGLAHTYEALDVSENDFPNFLRSLKDGKFQGISVTVPHKLRAFELADERAPSALVVGAANTLVRDANGKITAHNTDVGGLAREIALLAGADAQPLKSKTGIVIGTGGAARAAIGACAMLGARRVVVIGRRANEFANEAEQVLRRAAPNPNALGTTCLVPRTLDTSPFASADVGTVVQTTTCGMNGGPDGEIVASCIDWSRVPKNAIAYDVIYAPRETAFLHAAKNASITAANGLGMLVRQGAIAFELWLGVAPPLDVMRRAIDD